MEVKVKRKGAAASAFESFGSFVVKKYPAARMSFQSAALVPFVRVEVLTCVM